MSRISVPVLAPGITLIEVVLASVLILTSLGAALTMVGNSTIQIANNQHRLAATHLLQECMELTRNVRDSATRQTVWHCPFFTPESVENGAEGAEFFLTMEPADLLPTTDRLNCQQDLGVDIVETDVPQVIELNGMAFERLVTVRDIETETRQTLSGAREYEAAVQFAAQCRVSWSHRGAEYEVEAAQMLTDWQKT